MDGTAAAFSTAAGAADFLSDGKSSTLRDSSILMAESKNVKFRIGMGIIGTGLASLLIIAFVAESPSVASDPSAYVLMDTNPAVGVVVVVETVVVVAVVLVTDDKVVAVVVNDDTAEVVPLFIESTIFLYNETVPSLSATVL